MKLKIPKSTGGKIGFGLIAFLALGLAFFVLAFAVALLPIVAAGVIIFLVWKFGHINKKQKLLASLLLILAGVVVEAQYIKLFPTASNDSPKSTETASVKPSESPDATTVPTSTPEPTVEPSLSAPAVDFAAIPQYAQNAYVEVNGNNPYFTDDQIAVASQSYELYSDLDDLGRCGTAMASISTDTMPTEDRGDISEVKPTGWVNVQYDNVDGGWLYNRCHLIGYQLTAENANEENLITGTRYFNTEGMLLFENMVADYVKETGNHVLYRVTPYFDGNNLVASGVLMEGYSVEDQGDGIKFCDYVYNVQPGIEIDYSTGNSQKEVVPTPTPEPTPTPTPAQQAQASVQQAPAQVQQPAPAAPGTTYILNTNTKKFHYPSCSSVDQMSDKNKREYTGSRDDVIAMGYEPCKRCNP